MSAHALLFTLAATGIAQTAYLIRKRRALSAPVCPIGENCATVLRSHYNKLFGLMHNDIAGFLFYWLVSILTGMLVVGREPMGVSLALIEQSLLYLELIALALSAYFTYLQWRVIKAWCFWCLMSAATVAMMTVIVITSELIV